MSIHTIFFYVRLYGNELLLKDFAVLKTPLIRILHT